MEAKLWQQVVDIRRVLDISQRELAEAIGVAPYTITRWEKGQDSQGSAASLVPVLHRLVISVEGDRLRTQALRGLILMGIGPLFYHLLSRVI